MVSGRSSRAVVGDYEESRAQRIKENKERMNSLGIFDLSKKLLLTKPKKTFSSSSSSSKKTTKPPPLAPPHSPRRSSRLKVLPQVSYVEKKVPKNKKNESPEIHIPQGDKPEIYTDHHINLLAHSQAPWTLSVDGFDEHGHRIYDPFQGKTCHQCRQKTLGHHTECSKCKLVTGQLCGDCLYMRYGENVIEVNQNPNWLCAFCRGICNCSRCRRSNGWAPTGSIYRKVVNLGFKSVAHYLIHTFHEQAVTNAATGENPVSIDGSLSTEDGKEKPSDALPLPLTRKERAQRVGDDIKQDSDEEYSGDYYEDEDSDADSRSSN